MKVLDKACGRVAALYREMADVTAGILRNYAPESISAKAEEWVLPELGFALLGMLPEAMVKEGWLLVPGNMPVGMFAQVDRQGVEDFYRHLGGGGVKYV